MIGDALRSSAADACDPMDQAFRDLVRRMDCATPGFTLARVYGLQPDLLAVTHGLTLLAHSVECTLR